MKDYTHGPVPGFFRLWWGNNALFPILLALACIVLVVFGYQRAQFTSDLDAQRVVVEATAVDRREISVLRNAHTEKEYYVTFQYMADGVAHTVEREVPRDVYRALTVGVVRDIRHEPGTPHQFEFAMGDTGRSGSGVWWMSLGLALATLGASWWTARPALDAERARRFGAAEWAKVVRVDARIQWMEKGAIKTYVLVWRDRNGEHGESLPSGSNSRYVDYPPASDIEVYRSSGGKTWWVGDVGPRASAPTVPDVGKPAS